MDVQPPPCAESPSPAPPPLLSASRIGPWVRSFTVGTLSSWSQVCAHASDRYGTLRKVVQAETQANKKIDIKIHAKKRKAIRAIRPQSESGGDLLPYESAPAKI